MDTKQIISMQADRRYQFLIEKLPKSKQGEIVEILIRSDGGKLCQDCLPAGLEKRSLVIPDIETLKTVAGTMEDRHSSAN